MKSSFKKQSGSQVIIEVNLDPGEFDVYWQAAYQRATSSVRVKGFRPGSAPKELAGQAIDREKVFEEAVRAAVRDNIDEIAEEEQWTIIDSPKVEVLEAAPVGDRSSGAGLRYRADVTIFPNVSLGDYQSIAKRVLSEQAEVIIGEDEITRTLERLQQSRAKLTRVARPAARGDVIEVAVESSVDGKPIAGGKLTEDRFVLGESRFVPGFDDKIEGHHEGEKVSFTLTIPNDYWKRDLRGKEVLFEVKVRAVFERELSKLNDSFARSIGGGFKTIDDVRKSIREGLVVEREARERNELRRKMIVEIVKTSKIDLPDIMVEHVLAAMIAETKEMAGKDKPLPITEEELRKELRPRAVERLAGRLVIHAVSKAEHLEPNEEEVAAAVRFRNLDPNTPHDYSYDIAEQEKVFQFLESLR
jgi:trigger factor